MKLNCTDKAPSSVSGQTVRLVRFEPGGVRICYNWLVRAQHARVSTRPRGAVRSCAESHTAVYRNSLTNNEEEIDQLSSLAVLLSCVDHNRLRSKLFTRDFAHILCRRLDNMASQSPTMEVNDPSQLIPPPPPKIIPPQRLRNKPSNISIDSGYESSSLVRADIRHS